MFTGAVSASSPMMFFLSQFSRQKWLSQKRYQAIFLFEPLILLAIVYTNSYHQIFLLANNTGQQSGGLLLVRLNYGPAFWVHFAYSIGIYVYCISTLRRDFHHSGDLRRKQISILLVAASILLFGSLVSAVFLWFIQIDLLLLVYIAAALVIAYGILRFHLLDLMPVSMKTLLERLDDGILVTDHQLRIAEANTAMLEIMAKRGANLIGRSLAEVSPPLYQQVMAAMKEQRTRVDFLINGSENRKYVELHLIPLGNQGGEPAGYLINLSDITDRKQVEQVLRNRLTMEQLLADLSKNFINVLPHQMNLEIEQAVTRIGTYLHADYSYFYLFTNHSGLIRQSYLWQPELPDRLKCIIHGPAIENFPWIRTALKDGEQIHIRNRSELPSAAQSEMDFMEKCQCESLLAAPLLVGKELAGALLAASRLPNTWNEEDKRFLRLAGEILINAVTRTQSDEYVQQTTNRLKCLRSIDQTILSSQTLLEIAVVALRIMKQLIPYRQAALLSLDERRQRLVPVVSLNENGEQASVSPELLSIDPNSLGKVRLGLVNFVDDLLLLKNRLGIEDKLLAAGFVSYICSPLILRGEFAGLLVVTADRPGVFIQEHIEILGEIGYLLTIGMEKTRLIEERQETLAREERLNEIIRLISCSIDIESILDTLIRHSVELIGANAALVFLQATGSSGSAPTCRLYRLTLPDDLVRCIDSDMIVKSVCTDGELFLCNDLENSEYRSPLWQALIEQGFNRAVAMPVKTAGSDAGSILWLKHPNSKPFSSHEVRLLETLVLQTGIAFQIAQLYRQEHKRVMELEALRNTITDILTEKDLHILLYSIVDRARHLLNTRGGELALYEEGKDYLEVVVCSGLGNDYSGTRIALGEGGFGRIALTRQPIIVPDYANWEGRSEKYIYEPSVTFLGVPLIAGDRLLGALGLGDSNLHRQFNEEDVRLLTLFGQQAALAIEKAILFAEAQQRAFEAETLRQASMAVAASLSLENTIQSIVEQLKMVVPHDTSAVMLLKDGAMEVVGGYGFDDLSKVLGVRFSITDNGTAKFIYEQKSPLLLSDVSQDARFSSYPGSRIKSWLGLPLIIHGNVIGMLTLDSYEVNHFTPRHVRIGEAFADQVAVALENARLFNDVQQLAITDSLTGLFNRRYFMKVGAAEFERAIRYHRELSMVMLDIDFFKHVNDTYGHLVGDRVLIELAQRCTANLRDSDILCRYGGEEFIILFPETGIDQAEETAERLRRIVQDAPFCIETIPLSITISLGVVDLHRSGTASLDEFIARVDTALYQAKQSGRNRVCRWAEKMKLICQTTAIDS